VTSPPSDGNSVHVACVSNHGPTEVIHVSPTPNVIAASTSSWAIEHVVGANHSFKTCPVTTRLALNAMLNR
jgi:hypothetical protein